MATHLRAVLWLAVLTTAACTTNLRPAHLSEHRPTPTESTRGRALLAEALQAHGGIRWSQTETLDLRLRDQWVGLLGALTNPWPESDITVDLRLRVGTFDARAEFIGDNLAGTVWGMQGWRTYHHNEQGDVVFEDNDDAAFILAAVQYLIELPLRLRSAELVAYAGREQVSGQEYDVVFVTWGQLDAHREADQYKVYLDPATKRIVKAHYTVRDFARFAEGTIHYEDFRLVDGLLIPYRMSVTSSVDSSPDDYIHRIDVERVGRNKTTVSTLIVDPAGSTSSDTKPRL